MKKYIVADGPVYFHDGLIGLNKKQYEVRKRHLAPAKKKGVYEIKAKICLKSGEEILMEPSAVKRFGSKLVDEKEFAERAKEKPDERQQRSFDRDDRDIKS